MAYYDVCPICNATLDPGERCTCEKEKAKEQERFDGNLKADSRTGQIVFMFNNRKGDNG